MSSITAFKSILAPRCQSTFLYTALKIVLSLFFIIQLIIIVLIFMIAIFQLQFESVLDLLVTFGLFSITFVGIGLEYIPILIISTVYFLIYFFNSFFNLNFVLVSLIILFFNAFGLLLFTYLTFKGITESSLPDE